MHIYKKVENDLRDGGMKSRSTKEFKEKRYIVQS